jgi:hypothetical protein
VGLLLACAAGCFPGCSVQKLTVATMVPVIGGALDEGYASGDIATAREAIPSQMLLLRGLCRADSGRIEIWTFTVQLYGSFALTFIEPDDPQRAARLYREGMELGLNFLKRVDWFGEAWEMGPDELRAEIAKRKAADLAPLMMWTSACLGKHVLGNLDRPREMADLPYAYVLSDAAIALAGDYFYGMPHALKGVMLAATPLGLGGDLDESRKHFRKAMEIGGEGFLLHQVLFARYFCVAALKEDLFVRTLEKVIGQPEDDLPAARLINLLAREQAVALLQERESLF